MAKDRAQRAIDDLLDRGDRAGAVRLVDRNVRKDPSPARRWEQALVYGHVGLVQQGLTSALALKDTEAWIHIATQVWDMTLWAGRPDIGVSLVEEWLAIIEDREDIDALACGWTAIARAYVGLSSLAGSLERAEARLARHADLQDSGWRTESGHTVIGSAAPLVERVLPAASAAARGRFVSSGEFDQDYDRLLEALFGLSTRSPRDAWAVLDSFESQRGTLRPIGAPYRAQVAHRGGDPATAGQWLDTWFTDPLFPMTTSDLLVTGLLGFFQQVHANWLAKAASLRP